MFKVKLLIPLFLGLILFSNIEGAVTDGQDTVYVMPEQYAYVISLNSGNSNEFSKWGGIDKWNWIILWGRCPKSYADKGYRYKWVYGDGTKTEWNNINSFNKNLPFNSSYRYLSSDKKQYKTSASDSVTFYNASLLIADKAGVVISTTTLSVKAVNFARIAPAYGYEDPLKEKRLIMESIAKGRGLTWLYLKQDLNKWSWNVKSSNEIRPVGGTAISLLPYIIFGHTVYDIQGISDIFFQSVENGLTYLLSKAVITNNIAPTNNPINQDTIGGESDINKNKIRIGFYDSSGGTNNRDDWGYEMGPSLFLLSVSFTPNRAKSKVKIGSQNIDTYFYDVVCDAVDWAAWAQKESYPSEPKYNTWVIGGWGYGPNIHTEGRAMVNQSIVQWFVLGLIAIEENWNIKAPTYVRHRLAKFVKNIQYTSNFDNIHCGGALYYHPKDAAASWGKPEYFVSPDMWMTGTGSLLQQLFYLSMDTTTVHCDCENCKNHPKDDCTLKTNCQRVQRAIDFIGRNWATAHTDDGGIYYKWSDEKRSKPNYYSMYAIMKGLRLSNYQRGGINNGIIYDKGNFPPKGKGYQWEDIYLDCILNQQKSDGHWEGVFGDNLGDVDTQLALLLLGETVFYPSSIKTEKLNLNKDIQTALKSK